MKIVPSTCSDVPLEYRVFKHYEIRRCLGEGGFGQVFSAWDTKLCRVVAIKKIKPGVTGGNAESLIHEARMAASLQHSAFVKIHAIEEDDNSRAIVMEQVPGLTLKEWVRINQCDENRSLAITAQITEAMQEAHISGLIHGDLKPSNLIVEPSGKVRILDFGLAMKSDLQTTITLSKMDLQGTIAYMSPERLAGNLSNIQSDIYALGIILFEMLTGSRPFPDLHGSSLVAVQMHTSSDQWRFPSNISPGVAQLIRHMTVPGLDQRFNSMQQVSEQIAVLLANMSVQQDKKPITLLIAKTQLQQWIKLSAAKQRWLLASGVVITLSIGAWQLQTHPLTLEIIPIPYSESAELKQGFDALKIYDRHNSLDVAEKHFQKIIKHNTKSAAAIAGLSMVYRYRYLTDQQDESWIPKALASAQQAIALNGQLALSHIALASALNLSGRYEDSLQASKTAMNLDPGNFLGWLHHAGSLCYLKRFEEGKKFLALAFIRFPNERLLMDQLGVIYINQGDWFNAEETFKKSIKLDPDSVSSYTNLIAVLHRQNRIDEALAVAQQGLQMQSSATLQGNLGYLLFQKGDYVGAATAFENAVSPDKGSPNFYNQWANLADTLLLLPGREAQARDAYIKARKLLRIELAKHPDDGYLTSQLAVFSARLGEHENALTAILHALKHASDNADVQFSAALAYELINNRDKALTHIAKARELGYPEEVIETEPTFMQLRRDKNYDKKNN